MLFTCCSSGVCQIFQYKWNIDIIAVHLLQLCCLSIMSTIIHYKHVFNTIDTYKDLQQNFILFTCCNFSVLIMLQILLKKSDSFLGYAWKTWTENGVGQLRPIAFHGDYRIASTRVLVHIVSCDFSSPFMLEWYIFSLEFHSLLKATIGLFLTKCKCT